MSSIAMSNETDLDWLARNEHVWPINAKFAVRPGMGEVLFYEHHYSHLVQFTREQWLSRRAELQNKPSWKDAPEWANWLGQAENGDWEWYGDSVKFPPSPGDLYWHHDGQGSPVFGGGEVLGDWRDTLERRPEYAKACADGELASPVPAAFNPITSIEDNQELNMSQQQEVKQDNGWFERGELPPVGVECEILWNDAEWHKTKIIAHLHIDKFNICPVFTTDWDDTAFVDCMPHYKSFRPIRTEREVLVDAITSNGYLSKNGEVCYSIADAVIAAGFKLGAS